MAFSLFLSFESKAKKQPVLSPTDKAGVVALVRGLPGLLQGRVFTPADGRSTDKHHKDDGPGPVLTIQADFVNIQDLETACLSTSPLRHLADPLYFPSLKAVPGRHQAFATRYLPVPEQWDEDETTTWCTYLVEYPGPASDWNLWLREYLDHHPVIMSKFPNLRQIEISSPAQFVTALPFAISTAMQRNKVVFESLAELNSAMATPVRAEMAGDPARHVPIKGATTHFPMNTRLVLPPG